MKLTERYRTIANLPSEVPLFPLRGVILLPRAQLPLNVFEPRYVQMVEDAIAGTRLVGIIQPDRESGVEESPAGSGAGLRTVGTLGRIMAFQELDDHRYIVSLTGVARFKIASERQTGRLYRTAAIDCAPFAGDLEAGVGADAVDRESLLTALKAFLDARNLKADWASISKSANEQLVNSLSIMSPYGPEEKQALLEAADLKTRAELLVALAEMELASNRSGGSGSTLQ